MTMEYFVCMNELKLFPEKNIHKNVKTKGNVNISDGENLINFSC